MNPLPQSLDCGICASPGESRASASIPVILTVLLTGLNPVRGAGLDRCPAPSFAAAPAFDAGSDPRGIAAGDFNKDGRPDLAVVNSRSDTVSVLLGNGGGAFQTAVPYAAGSSPSAVVTGDFNGDNKLDLVVANFGRSQFGEPAGSRSSALMLLGNGDGTFKTAVKFDVGKFFQAAAVGDFNRDGKLDLAVSNNDGVAVLLGRGDATFQPSSNYATGSIGFGSSPVSVAVGDFDRDGEADLVVAGNGVFVLLGKGDGTFQSAVDVLVKSNPVSVVVGDINRDGKLDLAVASFLFPSGTLSILLGKGDGSFETAVNSAIGMWPVALAMSDFNADGKLDLAVTSSSGMEVLLGNDDGRFQRFIQYGAAPYPRAVAMDDFNGDGNIDLAVAGTVVSLLLGKGDGTFRSAVGYTTEVYPQAIATADFNADGKPDLAVTHAGSASATPPINGPVSVLLGNGNGTFQTAVNYGSWTTEKSAAVGDFNGDHKPDLAVVNFAVMDQGQLELVINSSIFALLGLGDGTFRAVNNDRVGASFFPGSLAVGDFNRDGNDDLVVINGVVSMLLSKGDGTFQTNGVFGAGSSPTFAVVGDFNADNKPDLATTSNRGLLVLLGKGDGTFEDAVRYNVGSGTRSLAVGDFNADGKLDLVVFKEASVNVSVLLGKGDGKFEAPIVSSAVPLARAIFLSLAVADYNGDGKTDVAVAHSNGVAILLGNGDGTFQAAVNYGAVGGLPVIVGDFNADGAPDLAVAKTSGGIDVLLNTCVSTGVALTVARTGSMASISWPLASDRFALESTTNLSPPNWQPALEKPMTNAARLEIILPAIQGNRFFRLHKP